MVNRFFDGVLDHPWKVIFITSILSLACAAMVLKIKIDPSVKSMILESDSSKTDLATFEKNFGSDEIVVLAFGVEDAFDRSFLNFLSDLTERLKNVDSIRKVESIVNTRRLTAEKGALAASELLNPLPEDTATLRARKLELLDTPLNKGTLFNEELTVASLLVRLKTVEETSGEPGQFDEGLDEDLRSELAENQSEPKEEDFYRDVIITDLNKAIAESRQATGYSTNTNHLMAGFIITERGVVESIKDDNLLFIPLITVIMGILLYLAFRNLVGMLLPAVIVFMSLATTVGLMVVFGVKLTIANSFLPVVVMIIAIADVIHIKIKYYEDLEKNDDKRVALHSSLVHIFKPCFYTSATTFFGFLSLLYSDIPPIREFGVFAAIGVIIAFLYSITFVPAVFVLLDKPRRKVLQKIHGEWMEVFLKGTIRFNERFKWPILGFSIALMIAAVVSIPFVKVETSFHKFFKDSSDTAKSIQFVDSKLAGSQTLEISLEALTKEGEIPVDDAMRLEVQDRFKDIGILRQIEKLQRFVVADPLIKKTTSLVDVVKEISKSMNPIKGKEDLSQYKLPDTTGKTSSYLFLFTNSTGPGELSDLVDSAYTRTRVNIRMQATSTAELIDIIARIKKYCAENISKDLKVTVTGSAVLYARMTLNFVKNQVIGFTIAITIIVGIIGFIFRSWVLGLLSIIPNVFPILMSFLFMAVAGVELNPNTIAVASISIGLVVDDTIHFFSRVLYELKKEKDHSVAIANSLNSVGRALGFTTFTLAGGFLILVFSTFIPTIWLGFLMALVIMVALIADLVLTSVVMLVTKPNLDDARA